MAAVVAQSRKRGDHYDVLHNLRIADILCLGWLSSVSVLSQMSLQCSADCVVGFFSTDWH